jgi:MOSC domain-containing protein YiiM
LEVVERHRAGVTVLRAHLAALPDGVSDAERRAILRETPLAESWQRPIRNRLVGD